MKGNTIVLAGNPRGMFLEGVIAAGQTPVPGTLMQIAAAALNNGRPQWTPNANGAGNPSMIAILLEDDEQGFIAGYVDSAGQYHPGTAYTAGARCRLYCPLPGEEVNVLVKSGENLTLGDNVILSAIAGKCEKTTGTPTGLPFVTMETVNLASNVVQTGAVTKESGTSGNMVDDITTNPDVADTATPGDELVWCMATGY